MQRLFFGNLDFRVTDAQLIDFLRAHAIDAFKVVVINDPDTSSTFGFAEVVKEDVRRAMALNGKYMGGRKLRVSEARSQRARSAAR